jgi:hypothetical protein
MQNAHDRRRSFARREDDILRGDSGSRQESQDEKAAEPPTQAHHRVPIAPDEPTVETGEINRRSLIRGGSAASLAELVFYRQTPRRDGRHQRNRQWRGEFCAYNPESPRCHENAAI